MNNGNIHWVKLPRVGGREQQGRRPAIIIQDPKVGGKLPTVIVVPLTSSKKALRFPGTTPIAATPESGLTNDSVALIFQCLAIDRSRINDQAGTISESERIEIQRQLRILTGESV